MSHVQVGVFLLDGEQLVAARIITHFPFFLSISNSSQSVRLHSIAVKSPADKGPKNIRIFINQPQTLDFDQVSSRESVQDITFTKDQIANCTPVALKYVKFQNVQSILIFVQNNQENTETTVIQQLKIIGSPINTTNMNEFKRVGGKKDERH